MKYVVLTSIPDRELAKRWDEFLAVTPYATHYVTPDFFADPFAGRGERFAILAVDGERIEAVLTGTKVDGKVVAGMAVRPQTAFRSGTDRNLAATALVDGLMSIGDTAELITFHSWEPVEGLSQFGFSHREGENSDRVVMLDLSRGPDELFKDFSARRRTDLRKTMKQNKLVVKQLETEAELAELYEIHVDWNRRKGNEPDPYESFLTILKSKHRVVLIALSEGKVVAGTYLRYCEGGVVEYAANNSLGEYQKLRPNELLGWRSIEWACSQGFLKFSMGASHPFLARFGGELFSSHRYQLDRTFLKRHNNRERATRIAVRAFQSLPESVRNRIRSVTA